MRMGTLERLRRQAARLKQVFGPPQDTGVTTEALRTIVRDAEAAYDKLRERARIVAVAEWPKIKAAMRHRTRVHCTNETIYVAESGEHGPDRGTWSRDGFRGLCVNVEPVPDGKSGEYDIFVIVGCCDKRNFHVFTLEEITKLATGGKPWAWADEDEEKS